MHRHLPTPVQTVGVVIALALIFGAPALAETLIDGATRTTPTGRPASGTVPPEPASWYCSDRAVVCGAGADR